MALSFDHGVVADALKLRLPQLLGGWSYAVYIGQTFGLLLIRVFEQRLYPPSHPGEIMWWLEPTLLLIFCVAWGAALAIFIEQPAARYFRR
jgi:peptidoglycan/LPS O-acetylase OafA/YrhL